VETREKRKGCVKMSKKLNKMEFAQLVSPILALPRRDRDSVEEMLRDKRLVEEADRVATYNRLMVPVAIPGKVTSGEEAQEYASGKGTGDA
jgi:hypothetical protein